MQNFGGTNKECYGIFESGLWCFSKDWSVGAHLVADYSRCPSAYMKLNKKKSRVLFLSLGISRTRRTSWATGSLRIRGNTDMLHKSGFIFLLGTDIA